MPPLRSTLKFRPRKASWTEPSPAPAPSPTMVPSGSHTAMRPELPVSVLSMAAATSSELTSCTASVGPIDVTSRSAAAMARSRAAERTRAPSGTAKATTTSEVVASTTRTMRRRTGVSAGGGGDEAHADPSHRVQIAGLGARLPQLAPQPRQVDVDRLVGTAVGLLPDLGQQLAPGHHLGTAPGQVGQEVELEPGEVELAAVDGRFPPAGRH